MKFLIKTFAAFSACGCLSQVCLYRIIKTLSYMLLFTIGHAMRPRESGFIYKLNEISFTKSRCNQLMAHLMFFF